MGRQSRILRSILRPSSAPRPGCTLALALLLILALASSPLAAQDVRLPGLQGGQLTDANLAQGATILVVWASWSPKCRDIVDRVNAIQSRWGQSARVVTVNFQEDRDTVQQFLSDKRLSVPVYLDLDGAFSKKSSITTLPGLLVVRDGATAYRGRLPDNPDAVIGEILR